MLPFLKDKIKSQTGVMIKNREPDQKDESEQQDNPDAALEACARDLINAIHSKDVNQVVQVLKDLEECKKDENEPMESIGEQE